MHDFELALQNAGFTLNAASRLESIIGRRMFSVDLTKDRTRMPERGCHRQGTLNLHVEVHGMGQYFDMRLEGVHPMGYGYEVSVQLVPLSDIQADFAANLSRLESTLAQSWLAVCPAQ
jgi:hypothetical protein